MPYPFASFGAFYFTKQETALPGTDSGWNSTNTKLSIRSPLGSARDDILLLAVGSQTRQFECLLAPARLVTLRALLGTVALFTDWERPLPNSFDAYLANATQSDPVAVLCRDAGGVTQKRFRVRVELISQN